MNLSYLFVCLLLYFPSSPREVYVKVCRSLIKSVVICNIFLHLHTAIMLLVSVLADVFKSVNRAEKKGKFQVPKSYIVQFVTVVMKCYIDF